MKIIISLLFLVLLGSCTTNNIVFFANNYEEVAKTSDSIPTLSARIIKLREFGECTNNTCPKEKLYIAISEFGEYPEQRLYITEKADEWVFVEWNNIPSLGDPEPTISFTLMSTNNETETLFIVKANRAPLKIHKSVFFSLSIIPLSGIV